MEKNIGDLQQRLNEVTSPTAKNGPSVPSVSLWQHVECGQYAKYSRRTLNRMNCGRERVCVVCGEK